MRSSRRVPWHLSRFDRLVAVVLALLLTLAILMIWRGDRVGVRVAALLPADGSTASTRTTIRVTFAQEMTPQDTAVIVQPAIAGRTVWDGRTLVFQPDNPLPPGTAYRVQVPAGLRSRRGQELLRPLNWEFHTAAPRLLYLGWDDKDVSQLYLISPDGADARPLTREKTNVVDYALSPDGMSVVYSLAQPDGRSSEMWQVDLAAAERKRLLRCDDALCHRPVWSPDGRRLLYEQRNIEANSGQAGPPRLWWLDAAVGQTLPLFSDSQWLGLGAGFSADGRWLSYLAPQSQAVQLYDLETGETRQLASQTGQSPAWNPAGADLAFTAYATTSAGFSVHLFRTGLSDAAPLDLSGAADVNDDGPIWSPDGNWIAFGRQDAGAVMGKQLWIMRADGSQARALTNDPQAYHVLPAWSPDSQTIAFQRYALTEANARPGLWLVDVRSGDLRQLVAAGAQPVWAP